MVSRVRLWVRRERTVCLQAVITIVSGVIAFVLAWYQSLTININLARTKFYSWLPVVTTYKKRLQALNILSNLVEDIATPDEELSGIIHRAGVLRKNDIGYREFLEIIDYQDFGIPEQIIYDFIEKPIGFDTTTMTREVRLVTSLKIKKGASVRTIKEPDQHDPMKILRELNDLIKFKMDEIIAKGSCIAASLLLIALIILAIL